MPNDYIFPSGVDALPESSGTQSLGSPSHPWKNIYVDNIYPAPSGTGGSGTAGVISLNGLTGVVALVAGSGITITPAGQNITIDATGGSGSSSNPFSFNEIPSGTINGINTAFSVVNAPINNSLSLFWNGSLLENPDDYTLAGNLITMGFAPITSSKLIATYEYAGSVPSYNWAFNEIPTGSIDSSNTIYTLASSPIGSSLLNFYNGILMEDGIGNDYTLAGNTVTFNFAPVSGSKIICTYIY